MELEGGCQCGAVRYAVKGKFEYAVLCHCADCRKSSGAPVVAWNAFHQDCFTVLSGEATTFNSSGASMRSFCGICGTGLWFHNEEFLPGLVDIRTATLDNPEAIPPQAHIQTAERIGWMESMHNLPGFSRYPEG